MTDIVDGAVQYLLGIQDCIDAVSLTPGGTPMIFQHSLYAQLEGTSNTAAVVSYTGGWTGAHDYSTVRFPRIALTLWADPVRDLGKAGVDPAETWRRLNDTWEVFDKCLHRPQRGEQWWGPIRTIGCVRSGEPTFYPVPDGDGLMRGVCFYNIEQG